MSRGLGRTQQAILDALPTRAGEWASTSELADKLDRSPRQIRTAVQALQDRGLLAVHKQVIDWKGEEPNQTPVYGALVMSLQSWADWLEKEQEIRDRSSDGWPGFAALHDLAQLGLQWEMHPADSEEGRDYQRRYVRARERRLNGWIADAVHCCPCRTCTCSCHHAAAPQQPEIEVAERNHA
jgi:hypothetical protein